MEGTRTILVYNCWDGGEGVYAVKLVDPPPEDIEFLEAMVTMMKRRRVPGPPSRLHEILSKGVELRSESMQSVAGPFAHVYFVFPE